MRADVLVIGTGAAGVAAAVGAARAGARVVISGGTPGGTALWSGGGEVYGPRSAPVAERSPVRLAIGEDSVGRCAAARTAEVRLRALHERFPAHPWSRLGVSASDIRKGLQEACTALGLPFGPGEGDFLCVTEEGVARRADLICEASVIRRDQSVRVLPMDMLPGWSASWVAHGLAHEVETEAPLPTLPLAAELGHHARALGIASLVQRDDVRRRALVDHICRAVQGVQGQVLLPALFGLSFEVARACRDEVEERTGVRCVEALAAGSSAPGLRLHAHLLETVEAAAIPLVPPVDARPERQGDCWDVPCGAQRVRATRLVVAAGGHFGRARHGGWIGAWLPETQSASRATSRSPWQAHAFLAEGLPTAEESLAVPGLDQVHAAGAVVAGHDPASDGTALGFALWSGWRAGCAATAGEAQS